MYLAALNQLIAQPNSPHSIHNHHNTNTRRDLKEELKDFRITVDLHCFTMIILLLEVIWMMEFIDSVLTIDKVRPCNWSNHLHINQELQPQLQLQL
jgi:hypothetical protein